jgi:hypothetical protein
VLQTHDIFTLVICRGSRAIYVLKLIVEDLRLEEGIVEDLQKPSTCKRVKTFLFETDTPTAFGEH